MGLSTILFHSCLSSTFALQPIIFILFRSSSTWSIHLNLGLSAGLVLYGVHSVIFLVVLVLPQGITVVNFAVVLPRKGLKIVSVFEMFLQATHTCHGQHVASYRLGGHVFLS